MRRMLVVALVILGGAITGAQGQGERPLTGFSFRADRVNRIEKTNGDLLLSGNVILSYPDATVTADTAIVHRDSKTIELAGRVQLKFPGAK